MRTQSRTRGPDPDPEDPDSGDPDPEDPNSKTVLYDTDSD
jgi:hypothetical protein